MLPALTGANVERMGCTDPILAPNGSKGSARLTELPDGYHIPFGKNGVGITLACFGPVMCLDVTTTHQDVAHVVAGSTSIEMGGVHASWVVTGMKHPRTVRNAAMGKGIGESVGLLKFGGPARVNSETPVATAVCGALPVPAVIRPPRS